MLAAFLAGLCRFTNESYATALKPSDFPTYTFIDAPGFASSPAEAYARVRAFFSSPHFANLEPLPGSRAVLEAAHDSGAWRFVVITARSDEIEPQTRAWLQRHYGEALFEGGVHFTNAWAGSTAPRTKGAVARELNAVGLIDDNVSYAVQAAADLPFVLLHGDYSWNRNAGGPPLPSNVVRTHDWREVAVALAAVAACADPRAPGVAAAAAAAALAAARSAPGAPAPGAPAPGAAAHVAAA